MKTLSLLLLAFTVGLPVPIDPPPGIFSPQLPSYSNVDSSDSPLVDHKQVPADPHDLSSSQITSDLSANSIAPEWSESTSRVQSMEHVRVKREEEEEEDEDEVTWEEHEEMRKVEEEEKRREEQFIISYTWDCVKTFPDLCVFSDKKQVVKEVQRAEDLLKNYTSWKTDYNLPVTSDSKLVVGRPELQHYLDDISGRDALAPFDSGLAAHVLFKLAAGAYGKKLDECAMSITSSAEIIAKVDGKCNSTKDVCTGHLVKFPQQKAFALVLRGSMYEDFESFAQSYNKKPRYLFCGLVNSATARYSSDVVENGIYDALATQRKRHPDWSLWVTGHGIGGSMATVAAVEIVHFEYWPVHRMMLITFAEPRTGDDGLALDIAHKNLAAYRVLNQQDLIVNRFVMNNSHWMSDPEHDLPHYNTYVPEIYYSDKMSRKFDEFVMCKSDKKGRCSERKGAALDDFDTTTTKMSDYNKYFFGVDVEEYGKKGCPWPDEKRPKLFSEPGETDEVKEAKQLQENHESWSLIYYSLPVSVDSQLVAGRPEEAPFDSGLAVYFLFPTSAGIYGSKLEECAGAITKGTAKVVAKVAVECYSAEDICTASLVQFPKQKAIALVFRGGKRTDYESFVQTYNDDPFPMPSGGKVNAVTARIANDLWEGLKRAVAEQLRDHPAYSLWVTGHGVGGSMASIMAASIAHARLWPVKKMILMTFGEPRTGDLGFAVGLSKLKLAGYRVVNQKDPMVNRFVKNATHWLSYPDYAPHLNQFYPEIYFKNEKSRKMNAFVLCNGMERGECSEKEEDQIIDYNKFFYGLNVQDYGKNGCPRLDNYIPRIIRRKW